MRGAQFKFYKKLSAITHDAAIVKHVVCTGDDMIKYYNNLHGHNLEDNLCKRRNTFMNCESSMITYYRNIISPLLLKAAYIIIFFMTTFVSLLQDDGCPIINLKLRLAGPHP